MLTTSCFCGAVRFETARTPRHLTACNCEVCRRYGALWAYFSRRSVKQLAPPGSVVLYQKKPNGALLFGHCKTCGCPTHHERKKKSADGSDTLALNLRLADDVRALADVPIRIIRGPRDVRVLSKKAALEYFPPR